ncbi:MAG: hypothetical protein RMZ41_003150 [Nostoc sp. DedVER02]|uniref:hypothetical protein n=1 Tax=unclassified Nostoc TaxID=2593658 RepID=UPI002AD38446|nr:MULTISPECIES: hypothetical protein [unclassified Nostoc]MDZ7986847.1 hypothetical protein [Nostoc sp. DedVER02]MDZ8115749.1 hypothetical protein [Nostoc sp. DedVER01b]
MEINDSKGWATIRLISAICNKNPERLSKLSEALTTCYEQKEISEIWRRAKLLLTIEDICWLETTLNELALQAAS